MEKNKEKKKKKRGEGGLQKAFLNMTLIPLILMGIVIILLENYSYRNGLYQEVQDGLRSVACSVRDTYDLTYGGEYQTIRDKGDGKTYLKKGNAIINQNSDLIDRIKSDTGVDISIFYYDTRMLTTVCNLEGARLVDTMASPKVTEPVLKRGEEFFTRSVILVDRSYFAQYIPIYSGSGEVVGMIAAAKPSAQITGMVNGLMFRNIAIIVLALIIAIWAINHFNRKLVDVIRKLMMFLDSIKAGTLNSSLDPSVLTREDEIGNIGRSAVEVQDSLRKLVERDPLTNLYNRRSAQKKVASAMQKAIRNDTPFSVCICDIDFFKRVNDTYGHDAGDEVLRRVSRILSDQIFGHGFAARWGGEEFLLVFDKTDVKDSLPVLEKIQEIIRAEEIHYEEQTIRVTLSFGIILGNREQTIEVQISHADERLYYAKEHGRDQICSSLEEKA